MGIVEEEQMSARRDLLDAAKKIREGRQELRAAVAKALQAELTITEISRLGEVSRPTIYDWMKES